ncbi:MAG TPA: hypothetical protein VFW40_12490 [Capsulimonadaceae bacterium]|nr:hypothetical protein [Capsulimonadaceae bacterium]
MFFGTPAAACGVAFFLAPNKEETLTWASAASTVLAGFFSTLCLCLWIRHRKQPGQSGFPVLAVSCLVLSTLFKEDALVLPLVLLVLDGLVLRPSWDRKAITPYIVMFLWLAVYAGLAVAADNHSHWGIGPNLGTLNRWNVVASFVAERLLFAFDNSLDLNLPAVLTLALSLGCVVFRFWGKRTLLALTFAVIVIAAPLAGAVGGHVFEERFNYAPDIFAALLWVIAARAALRSPSLMTRTAGCATLLLIVGNYLFFANSAAVKMIAFFTLPILYIACRIWPERKDVFILLIISEATAGLSLFVTDPRETLLLCALLTLAYVCVARAGNARQRLDACLASVVAYAFPLWGLLLAVPSVYSGTRGSGPRLSPAQEENDCPEPAASG